ncbi:DUF4337 domain-containing protein [Pseudogulbenkiania ferrooxidans]|uniref:DUF4337 domain-containing protein n=1 Tax=Pseudogulbenkiania ferrooxidans 2002 TaxID=279714 RepID=B9Z2G9_9NEIS|nr:DUF4337 domain-containing protein [Pseudogulbenkiania ferrooxidans]EEG08772.1 conserved hypothetical protein [Pseudogulbenkiania ferrooxidans 2002]
MEVEISVEAKKKQLNNAVAITVVLLSVFMGVSKIKDDNIVQAMQLAKADAVDFWAEYQSNKVKLHLAESNLNQTRLLAQSLPGNAKVMAAEEARLARDVEKYTARSVAIQKQAKASEAEYDRLNFHDDQFDMSDAALSVALATAAVAALVENWLLLLSAWGFGAFGVLFGLAGFAGWAIHPGWLVALLS